MDEFTNLAMHCAYCRGIFAASYNEWTNGFTCPHCNNPTPTLSKELKGSKGEIAVEQWLLRHKINYKKEFAISIKNKNFRYDFLVYDENNNPLGVIEVHGLQHYRPVEFFGGKEMWKIQTSIDLVKKHYALENFVFYYKICSVSLPRLLKDVEQLKFLLPYQRTNSTSFLISYKYPGHYLLERVEQPEKHLRGPFKPISKVNHNRVFKTPQP